MGKPGQLPHSTLLVALLTLPSLSMGMNVITHSLPLLKIHSRYSATPLPSHHEVQDPLPPPVYEAEPVQHVQPAQHYVDPYATHEQTDYEFVYSVKAPYHGDDHSHQETKTGDTTAGQYRVALPDGRIQIVTYRADDDGYQATVEYEGEQHYDPPIYNEPAPAYHPEPTPYHPEPIPYHPEPTVYHHQHPEPPPYHPEPTGFHLEANSYQPEPPTYQPEPPALSYLPEPPSYHHPEPFSFHPEPPHEPLPQHPIEPTYHSTPAPLYHSTPAAQYHPSPAAQYHNPSRHSTLYHPAPAPLHHGPLRRYGMLRPAAPKKYSYSPTPTPTPAPKYSYSPTPTPTPEHRPSYAYSPTPFPAGPKVFRPHPTDRHPVQYKSKITYENHPKEVKEVVRSMPSLLPTFTPSPASLDGFTARPAITLDPEEAQDPRSASLLDPEEIHQLPDLVDNHL